MFGGQCIHYLWHACKCNELQGAYFNVCKKNLFALIILLYYL